MDQISNERAEGERQKSKIEIWKTKRDAYTGFLRHASQVFKLLLKDPSSLKNASGFLSRGIDHAIERFNKGEQVVREPCREA